MGLKKRGTAKDKWNGFGGKQERGETVVQTMLRELKEEADVDGIDYEQVGFLDFGNDACAYLYLVTSWKGTPAETEEMVPQWFDIDQIPYDRMWPGDRVWLPRILSCEKLKVVFGATKDNMEFKVEML